MFPLTASAMPWSIPAVLAIALAAIVFAAVSLRALRAFRKEGPAETDGRFRSIVEHSPDLITRQTEAGVFLYASASSTDVLGWPPEQIVGRSVFDLAHAEDVASLREYLATVCRETFPWPFTYRVERKDGRTIWLETNGTCERRGEAREIIGYSRDVTERKRVEDHIAYLAYHDELTGLANRTLFNDRLTIALAQARRHSRVVAVLFLDLDHFKRINDTLGHGIGDQLLDCVAVRLRDVTRISDTVARLGGDEFAILLSEVAHEEDSARIARKILDALTERFTIEGHHVWVGASMGIALFPRDGEEPETLLKNADSAMYRAKNSGRNAYSFCTPESNARFLERLTLENSLRRAFEREEFVVYYQPVMSMRAGKPVSMEALIRWNDPERGVVTPAEFLNVAEESRLMLPIGEWVLRSACRQAKQWAETGNPMRVAVNLSARQFEASDLDRIVERALADASLDPSLLDLEIGESIVSRDFRFTRDAIHRLQGLGVGVSIDDFGAGTGSFGELKELPIEAVKVDSRFLRDRYSKDAAILSSVITAAQALEVKVVGKSVESAAQYEFLQKHQCDEMQGFLFGPPLPPSAVPGALRNDH